MLYNKAYGTLTSKLIYLLLPILVPHQQEDRGLGLASDCLLLVEEGLVSLGRELGVATGCLSLLGEGCVSLGRELGVGTGCVSLVEEDRRIGLVISRLSQQCQGKVAEQEVIYLVYPILVSHQLSSLKEDRKLRLGTSQER